MNDAKLFIELVPKITDVVSKKMEVNIALISKGKQRQFYDNEMKYILGYITAMSDILTQHGGGESGGSIVQSVIVRTLQELFGEEQGEQFFNLIATYMASPEYPEQFNEGVSAGINDTNSWLNGNQRYGIGKEFLSYFGV